MDQKEEIFRGYLVFGKTYSVPDLEYPIGSLPGCTQCIEFPALMSSSTHDQQLQPENELTAGLSANSVIMQQEAVSKPSGSLRPQL